MKLGLSLAQNHLAVSLYTERFGVALIFFVPLFSSFMINSLSDFTESQNKSNLLSIQMTIISTTVGRNPLEEME